MPRREYQAYHGTDEQSAARIMVGKAFTPSKGDRHWLGDGIYFFENDKTGAVRWCLLIKKCKPKEVRVIEVTIRVDDENVFDLTRVDHFETFHKIAQELILSHKKTGDRREITNGQIINFICRNASPEIYVVRNAMRVRTLSNYNGQRDWGFAFDLQSIWLAVRTNACISGHALHTIN